MDPASRTIISRAFTAIIMVVLGLYAFGFYKENRRKGELVSKLRILCGQSSYFEQFSREDAEKALVRALGLLAEAERMDMDASETIDKALQLDTEWFKERLNPSDLPMAQQIVRSSLINNYQNFIKLGYKGDYTVTRVMQEGNLPPLNTGSFLGRKPVLKNLIPSDASPGIEKVLANIVLCPPDSDTSELTDIQLASAKQLARDLHTARLIEREASEAILSHLDLSRVPSKDGN